MYFSNISVTRALSKEAVAQQRGWKTALKRDWASLLSGRSLWCGRHCSVGGDTPSGLFTATLLFLN